MHKTISIIIPTYNRAHLIGMTLDSIFAQTLAPYEVIVVDDGSSDGTKEMLETHYGNRITFLQNKGKGPGAARNTGLTVATGDYIKFFDSDDWMTPNTLETQLNQLVTTGKPYITSPYRFATEENGVWHATDNCMINYYGFPQNKPLTHWMIWGLFICIPTMLFKRSFLNQVGSWPEAFITSEDWAYLWRIAQCEPYPAHTNECFFYYRVHPHQSTGTNLSDAKRDREKFDILNTIYQNSVANCNFSWFEKALFRNKFYQMARVTADESFKNELLLAAGKCQEIIWQYYRLKMKIGRMRTGSDWQVMHGVKH